jgi:hypothetical protein
MNMKYYNSFHGKLLCALFSVMLCSLLPVSLYAAKPAANEKSGEEPKKEARRGKTFRVQFFSLKSGHSIAPATMILYDKGAMEIKVEHAGLITSRTAYTAAGYMFQADWEFIVKKEKPYQYVCHFSGLYLFNAYITGLLTMKEFIEEGRLAQEIPFIFLAVAADK